MFEDITNYLKELKVWALGKSILTFAVLGVAAISSAIWGSAVVMPAAIAAAIGGTILTAVSRFHAQKLYEDKVLDLYRDPIAQQLHISPAEVTRAHLHDVADRNPVIAEALLRQRKKTILTISTSALANTVSVLLIGVLGADKFLHDFATKTVSSIAGLVGIGAVSALSGLIIHQGLDALIGYNTSINKQSAVDIMLAMDKRIKRGQPVSREEVYGVLVARDENLARDIATQFGEAYSHMNPAEQSKVLHIFGIARSMDDLAQIISQGQLSPGQLAFMPTDISVATSARATTEAIEPPSNGNFVERLGLSARDISASHTERLAQQQEAASTLAARS